MLLLFRLGTYFYVQFTVQYTNSQIKIIQYNDTTAQFLTMQIKRLR